MLLSSTDLHHVIQNHFQRRGETWHIPNHHLLRSILRAALVADDLQREAPSITILGCRPATVASTTQGNQTRVVLTGKRVNRRIGNLHAPVVSFRHLTTMEKHGECAAQNLPSLRWIKFDWERLLGLRAKPATSAETLRTAKHHQSTTKVMNIRMQPAVKLIVKRPPRQIGNDHCIKSSHECQTAAHDGFWLRAFNFNLSIAERGSQGVAFRTAAWLNDQYPAGAAHKHHRRAGVVLLHRIHGGLSWLKYGSESLCARAISNNGQRHQIGARLQFHCVSKAITRGIKIDRFIVLPQQDAPT